VRYLIEHRVEVSFAEGPVHDHHCELRMVPRDDGHQHLRSLRIKLQPEADLASWQDAFGNRVHSFGLLPHHEHVCIEVSSEVEVGSPEVPEERGALVSGESAWLAQKVREQPRLLAYLFYRSASTPALSALAPDLGIQPPARAPAQPLLDAVEQGMAWIGEALRYAPEQAGHDSLEAALREKSGGCQDFAHLMISLARTWGFPARYVTGYRVAAGPETSVPGYGLYSWAEILVPGLGWRAFDVVRRSAADETYVAVAVGRDAHDAAPRRGVFKGSGKEPVTPKVELRVSAQ
jgi:transglutaminase-like putative cysteine protease